MRIVDLYSIVKQAEDNKLRYVNPYGTFLGGGVGALAGAAYGHLSHDPKTDKVSREQKTSKYGLLGTAAGLGAGYVYDSLNTAYLNNNDVHRRARLAAASANQPK